MIEMIADPVKYALGAAFRRIGTAFSAFLLAQDIPAEQVSQLLMYLAAAAGVSFDIGLAMFYRKRLKIAAKRMQEGLPQ